MRLFEQDKTHAVLLDWEGQNAEIVGKKDRFCGVIQRVEKIEKRTGDCYWKARTCDDWGNVRLTGFYEDTIKCLILDEEIGKLSIVLNN